MTAGRLLTRLQNGESEQVARTDCAHLLWSQRRGRGAMLFNYCPYRAGKGVCISLVISERVRFRVHKSPNVAPNAFPAPSCAEIDVQNPQKRILLLAKSWFSSHRHLRCFVCPRCKDEDGRPPGKWKEAVAVSISGRTRNCSCATKASEHPSEHSILWYTVASILVTEGWGIVVLLCVIS